MLQVSNVMTKYTDWVMARDLIAKPKGYVGKTLDWVRTNIFRQQAAPVANRNLAIAMRLGSQIAALGATAAGGYVLSQFLQPAPIPTVTKEYSRFVSTSEAGDTCRHTVQQEVKNGDRLTESTLHTTLPCKDLPSVYKDAANCQHRAKPEGYSDMLAGRYIPCSEVANLYKA